jgi:predicted nucleic acid-binding protein
VIVVVDACTLINLANGEVLSEILQLPDVEFQVSAIVRRESRTISDAIDVAVCSGRLALVDDALISVSDFIRVKNEFELDDGETECILAAQALACTIACDDAAARKAIIGLIGESRLTGSIGLLRLAIAEGLISREIAAESYQLMRQRGGFLPSVVSF